MGLISNSLPSVKNLSSKYEEINVVEEFRFVDVTLLIKDIDGKPVKDAEVKAFSEDWGLRYPKFGFKISDSNGIVIFHVPIGNWSFFAGGCFVYFDKKPGYGFFAIHKYRIIKKDSFITIQPDTFLQYIIKRY